MTKKSQANIGFAPIKTAPAAPKPSAGSSLSNKLAIVRALIKDGKGPKEIAKQTGLSVDDIKAIRRAEKSIETRKGNRQILIDMLVRTRKMIPRAEDTYMINPSGYNAGAVSALNRSAMDIIDTLTKLKKPEQQTLSIVQKILQPFLRELLRDTTGELRRARQKCLATAETPEAREQVMQAFRLLTENIGTVTKDHYSQMIPKLAHTMECDVDDLKRLASAGENEDATQLNIGGENVIEMPRINRG